MDEHEMQFLPKEENNNNDSLATNPTTVEAPPPPPPRRRRFYLKARYFMLSQILVLVLACIFVVAIFLLAEDQTIRRLVHLKQQGKAKMVNDTIWDHVQPAIRRAETLANWEVMYPGEMRCNTLTTDDATLTRLMNMFIRLMKADPGSTSLDYPFVHVSYAINDSFWGECGCDRNKNFCYLFNETENQNREYNQSLEQGRFSLADAPRYAFDNIFEQNYLKAIRNKNLNVSDQMMEPYSYRDNRVIAPEYTTEDDSPIYLLFSLVVVLSYHPLHKTAERVAVIDVDLKFISILLSDNRESADSDEYYYVLSGSKIIGASFPGLNATSDVKIYNRPISTAGDNEYFYTAENLDEIDLKAQMIYQAFFKASAGNVYSAQNIALVKKVYYCIGTFIDFAENTDWVFVYAIGEDYILKDVKRSRSIAYLLSAGVISLSCVFGLVIMRSILSPLKVMTTIIRSAAEMDLESIEKIPKSNVKEVVTLQEDMELLVSKLREFRPYLPDDVLQLSGAPQNADASDDSTNTKAITIHLHLVNRDGFTVRKVNGKPLPRIEFTFEYQDGQMHTAHRLLGLARQRANIATGRSVIFTYHSQGERWDDLHDDEQFFAAAAKHHHGGGGGGKNGQQQADHDQHGDVLECRIGKEGSMDVKCLLRCFVSMLACFSSGFLAYQMWSDQSQQSFLLTASLLVTTSIAIVLNLWHTHKFLKKSSMENKDLVEWLQERVDEASFGMFFGAFGVLNLEVIACKVTLFGEISLHAPFSSSNYKDMEQGCVPGLVMGPMLTIAIASTYTGLEPDGVDDTNSIELSIKSSVMTLNAIYLLMVLHRLGSSRRVMSFVSPHLKRIMDDINRDDDDDDIDPKKVEGDDGEGSGNLMELHDKPVTLVHCIYKPYEDLLVFSNNAPDPKEMEKCCNEFYEHVFRVARRYRGLVTQFYGGDVCVLFNGAPDISRHATAAIQFAFSLLERVHTTPAATEESEEGTSSTQQHSEGEDVVAIGIVTTTMKIGTIGTSTRRAFQHVSTYNNLAQSIAYFAQSRKGCRLLVTQEVALAAERDGYLRRVYEEVGFGGSVITLCQIRVATDEFGPEPKQRRRGIVPPVVTLGTPFVPYDKMGGSGGGGNPIPGHHHTTRRMTKYNGTRRGSASPTNRNHNQIVSPVPISPNPTSQSYSEGLISIPMLPTASTTTSTTPPTTSLTTLLPLPPVVTTRRKSYWENAEWQ